MAYKVTDACVNCGACDPECPVEAISEKNGSALDRSRQVHRLRHLRLGLPDRSDHRRLIDIEPALRGSVD